jgi:protein SCO1/2
MSEKKKIPYFVVLIVLFLLTLGSVYWYQNHHYPIVQTAGLYDHLGGDFTLKHKSGSFTLKNLKGKPSVLYFGFTSCPDICPLSLNKLNKVLDKIDPKIHSQINKVFISVDYKRDDAAKVDEYGKYFSDDFISLAGSKEQIEEVTKNYAVHFEFVELKDSAMKYTVDHTSRFYLLDSEGKIVNSYSDITNDHAFTNQIKALVDL